MAEKGFSLEIIEDYADYNFRNYPVLESTKRTI
jgi:hypothetical protein